MVKSGQVLFDFLPASKMFSVAEAVIRVFDRLGDRVHRNKNRMKFLVKQIGWQKFKEEVHAELALSRHPASRSIPRTPAAEQSPPSARRPRPSQRRAPCARAVRN